MTTGEAREAVDLTRAAGVAVHTLAVALFSGAALAAGLRVVEPPRPAALVVVGLSVGVVAGIIGWLPSSRRRLARAALRRLRLLRRLAGDRRRGVRLLASQIGLTGSLAAAFVASVQATSGSTPMLATVALYLAASALAASGPLPGGLGVIEPALAAGLMVLGVAAPPAVASVVLFRALTFWMPLLPAALAFRRLRRQGCC